MLASNLVTQAIAVVAKLGIADLLARGSRSADAVAAATGTDAGALYRLLRALASVGVFEELEGRRFRLTSVSELLRSRVSGSMRAVAILAGDEWRQASYHLLYSVRTGRPAFEQVYGMTLYELLSRTPEAYRVFGDVMSYHCRGVSRALLDAYDFSGFGKIVDVGGGSGALVVSILKEHRRATAVVFDTATVSKAARRSIRAAGLGLRCRAVAGDFFRSLPPGGDAYILAFILHNWDDERALAILRNCRKVMTRRGRLLVIEAVIPAGTEPFFGKIHDLEMLVFTPGGRERTEPEYRALFAAAGLRLEKIVPTKTSASVLEVVHA